MLHTAVEVTERVQLSNSLWAFAAVSRANFTFTFTIDYDYVRQISVEQEHPMTQSFFGRVHRSKQKDMMPVSHTISSKAYIFEKLAHIWRI